MGDQLPVTPIGSTNNQLETHPLIKVSLYARFINRSFCHYDYMKLPLYCFTIPIKYNVLTNKKSSYLRIDPFLILVPFNAFNGKEVTYPIYENNSLKKNGISVSNVLYADVGVGEAYASILICFAILIARFI